MSAHDGIPTLADALAGKVPTEPSTIKAKARVHRMGDDDTESAATLQKRVIAVLRVRGPIEREQLREQLGVADDSLDSPLNFLRAKRRIYHVKGKGYLLEEDDIMARTSTAAAPGDETKPRRKRKYQRRAKVLHVRGNGRATAKQDGAAHFILDDLGRIAIVGEDGARVDLSLPDTKRLDGFLERTKAFRK